MMWPLSGENGPSGAWHSNEVRQTSPDPQLTTSCGWVTQGYGKEKEEEKEEGGRGKITIHFVTRYRLSKKRVSVRKSRTGRGAEKVLHTCLS